jgi:hypothetical protein
MSAHSAIPPEVLLSSKLSIPAMLAWFWAYAVVAGSTAVVLGEAVSTMTGAIFPVEPTKIVTIAVLVLGAGAAQENVLVRLVQRSRH